MRRRSRGRGEGEDDARGAAPADDEHEEEGEMDEHRPTRRRREQRRRVRVRVWQPDGSLFRSKADARAASSCSYTLGPLVATGRNKDRRYYGAVAAV